MGTHPSFNPSTGPAAVYQPKTSDEGDSSIAGTVVAHFNAQQYGTWTVQPGNTPNTTPWLTKLNDGTTSVTIKPASTAATSTDTALVVALSPSSVNPDGQATMANSAPVVIASNQSALAVTGTFWQTTQPVSGTFWQTTQPVSIASMPSTPVTGTFWQATQPVLPVLTSASSGLTSSRVNAAATTNATSLKASAGNIGAIDVFNAAAYTVFLKLYDKASAPVGTDTPVWTIPIPTNSGFSRSFERGRYFATGIAYAITKLQADTDTTVLTAGDVTGQITWI